ncbi:Uncharacterised protein [Mycobacterium tuberculosis]|nr:Uncharacterised protein [Mycobacterium tuberculosis]
MVFLRAEHILEFQLFNFCKSGLILFFELLFAGITCLIEFVNNASVFNRSVHLIKLIGPYLMVLDGM